MFYNLVLHSKTFQLTLKKIDVFDKYQHNREIMLQPNNLHANNFMNLQTCGSLLQVFRNVAKF
jgi:hypothetical protein